MAAAQQGRDRILHRFKVAAFGRLQGRAHPGGFAVVVLGGKRAAHVLKAQVKQVGVDHVGFAVIADLGDLPRAVAGDRLRLAARVDDVALDVDERHAHDVILRHAVLQAHRPAGVLGNDPAQGSAEKALRVGREEESLLGQCDLQVAGCLPGVDHQHCRPG